MNGLILRGWRIEKMRYKRIRVWLLVECPYSHRQWGIPPQAWMLTNKHTWVCICCQIRWGLPGVGVPAEEIPKGWVSITPEGG